MELGFSGQFFERKKKEIKNVIKVRPLGVKCFYASLFSYASYMFRPSHLTAYHNTAIFCGV